MRNAVILAGRVCVTRRAESISPMADSTGMWVVAVGTADILVVHLALQVGTVLVDFFTDLSIGVIVRNTLNVEQPLRLIVLKKIITRLETGAELQPL